MEILPFLKIFWCCKNEKLDEHLKTLSTEHLQSFEAEFKRYFPELKEQEAAFVRNPFSTALDELRCKTNFVIFKMIRRCMMLSTVPGNSNLSVLVCYARILPRNIQTDFLNALLLAYASTAVPSKFLARANLPK